MNRTTLLSVLSLTCLILIFTGCGGGSGSVGTQPPSITTAISPTTTTVNAGQTTTVTFTATATVTNSTATPTFSGSVSTGGGTISAFSAATSAGSDKWTSTATYTAPGSVPAQNPATVTVTGSLSGATPSNATAQVTINAAQTIPTLTFTGNSSPSVFPGTESATFTTTGNPTSINCGSQDGFGPVSVNGNTVSVPLPNQYPQPTLFVDALTCTPKNSVGTGQAVSTQIVLQYSVPTLTSMTNQTVYCYSQLCTVGTLFNGSGFYFGDVCTITFPESTLPITLSSDYVVSYNQILIEIPYPFNTGFAKVQCASPATGNGGGTSNMIASVFTGNMNITRFTATDIAVQDQQANTVSSFTLPGLKPDGSPIANAGGTQIAFDPRAGTLLDAEWFAEVLAIPSQSGFATPSPPISIGAETGESCFTMPFGSTVGCFTPSTQMNPTPAYVTISGSPWNVEMTIVNGVPTAVILEVENDVLYIVDASQNPPVITGTVNFPGCTPLSKLPSVAGGWDLAVSGTNVAGVCRYDGLITFFDLSQNPPAVVTQKSLSGTFLRMDMNPVDFSAVIAVADITGTQTTAMRVDSSPGTKPKMLNATFPGVGCGGWRVSSDGTTIYCGNAGTVSSAPNQ